MILSCLGKKFTTLDLSSQGRCWHKLRIWYQPCLQMISLLTPHWPWCWSPVKHYLLLSLLYCVGFPLSGKPLHVFNSLPLPKSPLSSQFKHHLISELLLCTPCILWPLLTGLLCFALYTFLTHCTYLKYNSQCTVNYLKSSYSHEIMFYSHLYPNT